MGRCTVSPYFNSMIKVQTPWSMLNRTTHVVQQPPTAYTYVHVSSDLTTVRTYKAFTL